MEVCKKESLFMRMLIVAAWVLVLLGTLTYRNEWFFGERAQEEEAEPAARTGAKRVLRILAWGDIFDQSYIQKFEQEYNVTIHMGSYTTNEELIVKLKGAKGRGYDLIVPSDYAVALLRADNLLKPLDKKRMPFLARLNPVLLGQSYDPQGEYSVPFEWEVFGIAYDREFFANRPLERSWSMLFSDPHGAYRVVVSDDTREMIRAAAHVLFGAVDELTPEQVREVEQLLKRQRSWVEAYASTNLDYYLISGSSRLAFASSAYVARRKNFATKLGFFVPREGGLVTIENLAMPIHGENDDLVYAFMEFIFSPESMMHHFVKYTYFPATLDVLDVPFLSPEIRSLMTLDAEEFKKLIFIKQIMPEEEMNHLWVTIKS